MTITKPHQRAISALAATLALAALVASPAQAQIFTILLHYFPVGEYPWALLADPAGNFYGTTLDGGPSKAGTLFRLDKTGYTLLYSFTGGPDGSRPNSLVRDSAGNLYGTALSGGNTACFDGFTGCGVVFKLDTTGAETTIYTFDGPDVVSPGGLIRGPQGNLYGTAGGGTSGSGVVFKLDATGAETVLHNFAGGVDGSYPQTVILGLAGDLYGITSGGGQLNGGALFKLDRTGETVLHSFTGGVTSLFPYSLIRDSAGNIYGVSLVGGSGFCSPWGCGVVFKLDTSGAFTVLYTFTGGSDGGLPTSVALDSAGNLYGTAYHGGLYGFGVVYELDTAGNETVLYNFQGKADGATAYSLIRGPEGNLYGISQSLGSDGNGIVFRLRP